MRTKFRALRVKTVGWHLLSVAIVAVFAAPLLFALSLSLRQIDRTLPTTMEWLPNPIVLGNYARALADGNLIRYGLNSLLVVAVTLPVTLVVASWAGLAMARGGHAVQRRMVAFCVVALLIPHSMIWLPRFLMVKWVGLIDSPFALMLPALMGTSPLFALLFYWAFRRQPADLFDAAAIDGAGALRVWWSMAFPLVGPTAMAVAALTFLYFWGDYIDPLLMIKSPARYTLPVGLSILQQFDKTRWPLVMAAAVLYALPSIGVFLAAQRYFLSGRRMLWLT